MILVRMKDPQEEALSVRTQVQATDLQEETMIVENLTLTKDLLGELMIAGILTETIEEPLPAELKESQQDIDPLALFVMMIDQEVQEKKDFAGTEMIETKDQDMVKGKENPMAQELNQIRNQNFE